MLQAAVRAENSVLDNLRQTHPIPSCLEGQTTGWDEISMRLLGKSLFWDWNFRE